MPFINIKKIIIFLAIIFLKSLKVVYIYHKYLTCSDVISNSIILLINTF